jgi:uncharacterized membrane protein
MAIHLHTLSARSLHGALVLAALAGIGTVLLARRQVTHEILVAVAWDLGVLLFLGLMLAATSRSDERKMASKVRHRSPSVALLAVTALASAGFGIYAIILLLGAAGGLPEAERVIHLAVGAATTTLSWALVHLLFALSYARVYYEGADPAAGAPPEGGLDFPGGHPPDYADFLYFSFVIGVASQTADVDISSRRMRRLALAHGLIAFVFNTVILAATINVAAGLV